MNWLEFTSSFLYILPVYILIIYCITKCNKYERITENIIFEYLKTEKFEKNVENKSPLIKITNNKKVADYNYDLLVKSIIYYEDMVGCMMDESPRMISSKIQKNKNKIIKTYEQILIRKDILSKVFYYLIVYNDF